MGPAPRPTRRPALDASRTLMKLARSIPRTPRTHRTSLVVVALVLAHVASVPAASHKKHPDKTPPKSPATPAKPPEPAFDFAAVVKKADRLAAGAFQPPETVPDWLVKLSYDQWRD